MARGQQKLQSQAKAAEKAAKMKKQSGHSANDQKKAAQKALVHVCVVCKVSYKRAKYLPDVTLFYNDMYFMYRHKCPILKRISNTSKINILKIKCPKN